MTKQSVAEFCVLAKDATEEALRAMEVPWPKTPDELRAVMSALVDREHTYGTCVYAMSMSALAAYYYVSHALGVTGFQASCADMDFIGRARHMKCGFRILNYDDLLYPQYCDDNHFPSHSDLLQNDDVRKMLRDEANKRLLEETHAHPKVRSHWEWLAS